MQPLKAILVARVSTKRQAAEDTFSIEAQFRYMREVCARKGIEIVAEHTEPGTSAFTPHLSDLPVLEQAIIDIENGIANALVMHESSRLARNEQLANHIFDRLEACGARFINSMMDIDYTSPEGRLFFNNEASMNAYSSRKTSQHSKKGKLEQFLQGLPVGKIPFGYEAQLGQDGKANRKLPPIPRDVESQAVREAILDRALGRGLEDIARDWNARGLRPQSVRGVTRFTRRSVQAIVENPFYLGYVSHLGEQHRGLHDPIVTEEEWADAQRPKLRVTRRQLPPLLAQGIATCARCSRPIYPSRPGKGPHHPGEHYLYYREPSKDSHRDCPDRGLFWPSAEPDRLLDELMRSLTMSDEWLEYVRREAEKVPEGAAARRAELEESIRRVRREYFRGGIDEDEYHDEIRDFERELASLPPQRLDVVTALTRFEAFGDLWGAASAEARNDTCRVVFESVVFDMRERRIVELRAAPEFEPLFQLRRALLVSDIPPVRR